VPPLGGPLENEQLGVGFGQDAVDQPSQLDRIHRQGRQVLVARNFVPVKKLPQGAGPTRQLKQDEGPLSVEGLIYGTQRAALAALDVDLGDTNPFDPRLLESTVALSDL
jgi:hypothetical protein